VNKWLRKAGCMLAIVSLPWGQHSLTNNPRAKRHGDTVNLFKKLKKAELSESASVLIGLRLWSSDGNKVVVNLQTTLS